MRFTLWLCAFFIPFFFNYRLESIQSQLDIQRLNDHTFTLNLAIPVPEGDALYADSLSFSVDHPHITLSEWNPSVEPTNKYDTQFKQVKKIFTEPFSVRLNAELANASVQTAQLHMVSLSRASQKNKHQQFALVLHAFDTPTPPAITHPADTALNAAVKQQADVPSSQPSSPRSLNERINNLFTHAESWGMRLLLALLLGLMLSLTPCIYPMIPITVGILQSQGSSSMGRNFLISLAYICGIATTFALLGTTAAFTGKMFGSIMNSPIVIITIVGLLIYLAGSMIGLYEMYLPSFLKNSNQKAGGGGFFSTFLFGAASGTVASPCLSPGLLLLLTMVTALGSVALGFALLFSFGLGLGIPLLIIGTFSGSINMLPRAGIWMVDIKQFFGFLMLATCFYFLANILPPDIIAWSFAIFVASVGIFYCAVARTAHSVTSKLFKTLVGIALIAGSVYLFFNAYKQTQSPSAQHISIWEYDYGTAIITAQTKHQKILLDISAPYCSICKAIDKKIFAQPQVQAKLQELVAVKIEDIEANETTLALQKKFNVVGAPTIILYDPEQDHELKRWGGELYEWEPAQFARELE